MTVEQQLIVINFFSNRYLQYGLSDTLFSSNCTSVIISYVVTKDIGHRIAWDFVTENWPLLNERYGKQPALVALYFSFLLLPSSCCLSCKIQVRIFLSEMIFFW